MVSYFTHGTTLAYRSYGQGPVHVIAFHGFGRTGEDFQVLEGSLGDRCTIHAFDLHFHGHSPSYPQRAHQPFTPEELSTYFTAFTDGLQQEKVSLLGYSLGGRLAMSLVEHMPERIERLFLAAPDGLKNKPWYRALAGSRPGRSGYERFVERPEAFHLLINALHGLKLMNSRMHRFLIGQTDSRAKRVLIHDVWLSYRQIEPDLARVAARAREHGIPIHLYFGEHDRVIKPALGQRLLNHAPDLITQEDLPFGHVILTRQLGLAIRSRLLGPGVGK